MNSILVSVVVPIYNAEKYLKKCINSILNQTYSNFELILVNDGSTDLSLKICENYLKRDRRIKLINKINQGSIATRRRGIEEAIGDYVMFIDADDWVHSKILERLVMDQQKNQSDVVVCNMYKVFNNRAIIKIKNKSHYFDSNKVYKGDSIRTKITEAYLHGHPFPAGLVAKLYKKELLLQGGNYLKHIKFLGDDLYYNLEIFLKCTKISIITEPLYYYRTGGNTSRYMSYHFDDIVAGFEIQKKVIEEYYTDSIQKRMNGISIMLLTSFKTTLLNLHRSNLNEEEIKERIRLYCENESIKSALENEGVNNYFEPHFLEAIRNSEANYLKKVGEILYDTSCKNNRLKKLISLVL